MSLASRQRQRERQRVLNGLTPDQEAQRIHALRVVPRWVRVMGQSQRKALLQNLPPRWRRELPFAARTAALARMQGRR